MDKLGRGIPAGCGRQATPPPETSHLTRSRIGLVYVSAALDDGRRWRTKNRDRGRKGRSACVRHATSTSGVFGSKPPSFPVWKRGSIASEPDLVRLTTWSIPAPAPACPARRSYCAVGRTTCSNPTCGRRLTTSFRSIGSSASLCRFWFNLSRVPEKRDPPTAVFGFHSSLVWFDQSRPEISLV
jgi:hypothetical protein